MNQSLSLRMTLVVLTFSALLLCAGRAQATDISGTYSTTLTIFDDSELVGPVTCTVAGAPCIQFGAPGIKLRLNGFTITGPDVPPAGCTPATSMDDGIDDVVGLHHVAILGPGRVQDFGGFGIGLFGSTTAKVEGITVSDNCFSGIFLGGATDSDIEKNVSVRNSVGSQGSACGGT
jgi:Right handed beta helix region